MLRRAALVAAFALVIPFVLTGPADAAAAQTDYVALGDSYSAGVGAPGQTGSCSRGTRGYPALWAAQNDPQSYRLLACSGATTADVKRDQIPSLTAAADLITITVGGNDAGFVAAVTSCTIGSDQVCAGVVAASKAFITTSLRGRLDSTFAAIKQRSPDAEVVVLGYPRLFDTTATGCGVLGLSQAKRRSLNSGADALDTVLASRAAAAGFTFADVRDRFAGHGACGSSPWINTLTLVPAGDSYHPNANGYAQGYLPALTAAL